jgi:small subunit ribosomal protein S17
VGEEVKQIKTSGKKEFVGIVKNKRRNEAGQLVGMDKTLVVAIQTTALHPLYKKYVRRVKKVKAHDERNEANTGDTVRVVECRPISKEKCWRLESIVEKAK